MPKGIDKKWSEEETVMYKLLRNKNLINVIDYTFFILEKICKRVKTVWKEFPSN